MSSVSLFMAWMPAESGEKKGESRMNKNWFRLGFAAFSLLTVAALTATTASGCGDDDDSAAAGSAGSGGGSSLGPCFPTGEACGYEGTQCLSKVDQSSSAKKVLRMSQLQVSAPAQLATQVIQDLVLRPGVTLPQEDCFLYNGKGTFNWLFEFDPATSKGRTGGAKPITDLTAGYCFVNEQIGGIDVGPTEVDLDVTDNGDGSYKFATKSPIARVVVPIYLDVEMTKTPILLPLNNVSLTNGVISENGNCIGRFRGKDGELDPPECAPDTDATSANYWSFENAATLAGTIKIDEADQVIIVDLNNVSLCAFLAKLPSDQKTCANGTMTALENDKALAVGVDTDNDGKADSFALEASFAASGTKFSTADGNCQ
ncbi:MAG: hypothetical protein U0165_15420 [Polyangiaceae bacterium]